MTKSQLKEKYIEWNIAISKEKADADKYFKELQELNAEFGDGSRWCCMALNVKGLLINGYDVYKVMELTKKYDMAQGKMEALSSLALATKNFEI